MNKKYKIIALLVAASTLSGSMAFADNISDAKEQSNEIQQKIEDSKESIAGLEEEKKNIADEISSLDSDIQELSTQVDRLNIEINESERRITELENRAEELKEEIELNKEIMAKRFRVIYQSQGTSYLNIILESKGFGDFLKRLDTVKTIANYNQEIMDEFKNDQIELAENTRQVTEEKISLQNAKAAVDEDIFALEGKRKEKQQLMEAAESNIEAAEAEVAQLESDFNEILASINKMEEEQRQSELARQEEQSRQEEAAKQEAAQNNSSSSSNSSNNESSSSGSSSSQGNVSTDGLYRISKQRYAITSGFVDRINPITGQPESHKGIDIGAPYGDPVYALKAGTVSYAGWMTGYGNVVVINHGGGMSTLYAHNSALTVSVGQYVEGGQQVSVVGSTGWSTGPHIHFEVIINGVRIDPINYYI